MTTEKDAAAPSVETTAEKTARLTAMHAEHRELGLRITALSHEIAADMSEFKVGDRICWVYGKGVPENGIILKVLPQSNYMVRRKRKNGTDGAVVRLYSWHKITRYVDPATVPA